MLPTLSNMLMFHARTHPCQAKDVLEDSFGILLRRGGVPVCAATLNLYAPDHARIQVGQAAGPGVPAWQLMCPPWVGIQGGLASCRINGLNASRPISPSKSSALHATPYVLPLYCPRRSYQLRASGGVGMLRPWLGSCMGCWQNQGCGVWWLSSQR